MDEKCACGRYLHYVDTGMRKYVEEQIANLGPNVKVTIEGRSWMVPRHYIALHGLWHIKEMGFEEVLHPSD